tara:strand:- start:90 stop:542 length:453 start_codon:yes stop_codon:yes gene_type:complete
MSLDLVLIFLIGIPFSLFLMYFNCVIVIPLLISGKIYHHQSTEDIYSTQPHGKILIFSIFTFSLSWWLIRDMFLTEFDDGSWLPILFYFIIYTISYYEAQSDKGKKSYLQRAEDGEELTFQDRPNLYNQLIAQCLVILALTIYQMYLIFL